jgi:hypothetical protein
MTNKQEVQKILKHVRSVTGVACIFTEKAIVDLLNKKDIKLKKCIEFLRDLKTFNNHTIEEEFWRINDFIKFLKDE